MTTEEPTGHRPEPGAGAGAGAGADASDTAIHDVAVVGAGPVGLLVATLLAQQGVDVVVLDRRTEPTAHSRAIGIHPPGLRALAAAGIVDAVVSQGVRITDGAVACDRRVLARLSFEGLQGRHPFVIALPQARTVALLTERLLELAPGAMRRGAEVTGLDTRNDSVELTLGSGSGSGNDGGSGGGGGGSARDGDGGAGDRGTARAEAVLRARYVVGADGVQSVVRQLAGISWRRRGSEAHYVMGDFAAGSRFPRGRAMLFFERGGVVESFPLPGGQRRWVALTPDRHADATPERLAGFIRERTGITVDTATNSMVSAFSARQHEAERMVCGRVALVGDAAHEISPIGGQGMNLGWLDAVHLARALGRALGADGFGPSIDADIDRKAAALRALTDYDRVRRRSASRAIAQAGFNMNMGRPAGGVRLRARNALVRTLATWPTRRLLANAFTMRWL